MTNLDFLYLVLIFFSTIIGTLLILILLRVLKILGPVIEVVDVYNKVKNILKAYSSIPDIIKKKVTDTLKNKKDS